MNNIKSSPIYLLFDLDGTLVDSLPDLAKSLNLLRAEMDCPALDLDQAAAMVGDGVTKLVNRALGPDLFRPEHVDRFLKIYNQHLLDNTRCYHGIESFLNCHDPAHMGIVSNKPLGQTIEIVTGLNIRDRFNVIFGGDSMKKKKPDPQPVLKALETLGGSPGQAVMIGDHHTDLYAGRAAGTATCFCAYGIGNSGTLSYEYHAQAPKDLLTLFPASSMTFNNTLGMKPMNGFRPI